MTTVSKAKKTAAASKTIPANPPPAANWQPIDPFYCEFEGVSGEWLRGEAREGNAKMYEITYSDGGEQRQVRVPIGKVKPIEATETAVSENLANDPALAEILQSPEQRAEAQAAATNLVVDEAIADLPAAPLHPTEFTEHEPIAAVYRKGKKEIDVKIVATRNDGNLYRIVGNVGPNGTAGILGVPIEKVMIVNPEPAAEPQQEPAAAAAVPEGWAVVEGDDWERKPVEVDPLKGSGESPAQISNRYSNQHEREIRDKMLLGLWQYDRPGSEPRLFWDGTEYHTGDGHHTIQALQVAHAWLDDAREVGLPGGTEEAIAERFTAGLITLPSAIPCYVRPGTATHAHAYSLREANRFHGLKMSPDQKRAGAWDAITDRDMLAEVVRWICIKTGKDFAKFADSIPADRAIAEWLGNVSAPTVADVWAEAIEADSKNDDMQWPWLFAKSRMGLDGKVQKIKVKEPKPEPKAPATPPQVKKLTPETEPIDDEDTVDRSGNSVGGGGGGAAGGTDPAPTDSAPVTPGQTYTGKARIARINELAEETATKLIQTIAAEMKTKIGATEAYDTLLVAIKQELEWYVAGDEF